MNRHDSNSIDQYFDTKRAEEDLARYKGKGVDNTTGILLSELKKLDLEGKTVLDIGAGVGVIPHELVGAGCSKVMLVDASRAFAAVARRFIKERQEDDRICVRHGDFVEIAGEIEEHDIVTLDKMLCCCTDMKMLVTLSAEKAREVYALVYLRDTWWIKLLYYFKNKKEIVKQSIHISSDVEEILVKEGL